VIQLDEKVAAALASLRMSADFRTLMEWLKEDERAEQKRCVEADGVALHRAQGAAKKLQELQQACEDAPSIAKKLFDKRLG
jgi:hypothetical protein